MKHLFTLFGLLACFPYIAQAKVIEVGPGDDFKVIEAAKAGDVVEIAPGTYQFRVQLEADGTESEPITIRAKDPLNRPIWDLQGKAVGEWPGSNTYDDKGRGCWQVKGRHYIISGIVFKNCQDKFSSGIRVISKGSVTIRDCLFEGNTSGIYGSADKLVVEFCEFSNQVDTINQDGETYDLYINGGQFTLRYSYIHDPVKGFLFHIGAREAVLEYNWFARSTSYPGEQSECYKLCGSTGKSPITQSLLLRGNVFFQGEPSNSSKIVGMLMDNITGSSDDTGMTSQMDLTAINNTVIGKTPWKDSYLRFISVVNSSGTSKVHLSNNILYNVKEPAAPTETGKNNWSLEGKNNWVHTGTSVGPLTDSVLGDDPGFVDAQAKDFHLKGDSACRNKAGVVDALPTQEYYFDETIKLMYRPRATVKDIGAFEYGNTAQPVDANGNSPSFSDGGLKSDGTSNQDGGAMVNDSSSGLTDGQAGEKPGTGGDDGCGCSLGAAPSHHGHCGFLLLCLLFLAIRRKALQRKIL